MDSHADIGALLKKARVEMKMDMLQASSLLHIRVRYLEAMEQGRFNDLPGLIYIKGYLQAYASFLELDKDEIIRRFDQVEAPFSHHAFTLPQVLRREKSPGRLSILFGLLLSFTSYGLWALTQNTQYAPDFLVDAPSDGLGAGDMAFNNGACFHKRDVLYPPCYRIGNERYLPPPMHGRVESMMDLYNMTGQWFTKW